MNGTLIEIGLAASCLALAMSVAALVLAVCSRRFEAPAMLVSAKRALIVNFVLITLSCFTIVWSFVIMDLSVLYVANNANNQLPMLYRLTALWGAHEGSLMLWLWYLTLFSALAVMFHWRTHPLSMPYVVGVLSAVQTGFMIFILFLSSPFTEIHPPLPEGRDLNPLLQDPGLAFHPPLLYMGYVGFAVPFAFAIAALLRGQSGREWIVATRRWTLFAWVALTSGIFLGGYWAYYELGWGGYWAWDPVENASLLPWLTATAFLHSVMAQEQRNLFQSWNVFLIISTFVLSILGTFLVRSGVLSSVHAFAADPGRGVYILLFLSIVSFASYGLLIVRAPRLAGPATIGSVLSREMMLLLNNLLFVSGAIVILLGTLYPLAIEVISDDRVTIAAPYFNTVMPPITLLIVLLMAVGPFVSWRQITSGRLKQLFFWPMVTAGIAIVALLASGNYQFTVLAAVGFVVFAAGATFKDIFATARIRSVKSGEYMLQSFWRQLVRNPRRYGGLTVHMGVLILLLGIVASAGFRQTTTVSLVPGERTAIGAYVLTFRGVAAVDGLNYTARRATIAVAVDGRPSFVLYPENRSFTGGQSMVTTEAGIRTTIFGDLYLVLGNEGADGRAMIQAFWNPLVVWIWIGWLVILVGVFLALLQRVPARYRLGNDKRALA